MKGLVPLPTGGKGAHELVRRYQHKSYAWCFEKALAVLALRADPEWRLHQSKRVTIECGRVAISSQAVLAHSVNQFFDVPIRVFNDADTAALRAQTYYWSLARRLGDKP